MESYTYGSKEGVQAVKDALLAVESDELHYFRLSVTDGVEMANSLETAAIAGNLWGEVYTGISWTEAALWSERLTEMELTDEQVIGFVDALALAYNLGDDFAGGFLSGLGCTVDVDWV